MRFAYKFIFFFSLFTVISIFLEKHLIVFFMFFITPFAKQIGAAVLSNQISVNGNFLLMAKECTGMQIYSIFLAFAFSYRFRKENLKYIVLGMMILVLLNYLRIISLIGVASLDYGMFTLLHGFLWPASFFLFAIIGIIYYKNEADKKTA